MRNWCLNYLKPLVMFSFQADQHVKQVTIILKACSENTYNFEHIFNRKNIRDKWLVLYENSDRKPATVKAYITSLRYFFTFIVADNPEALEKYKDACHALIITWTDWIALYRKKQRKGQWKRDMEQLSQLFTATEIKVLDNSELVKYCKDTLKKFSSRPEMPTLRQFSNARDYILMYLCLECSLLLGCDQS